MVEALNWKHDRLTNMSYAQTDLGMYLCARTWLDMSVLTLNGTELARNGSGSHEANMKLAEEHYASNRKEPNQ